MRKLPSPELRMYTCPSCGRRAWRYVQRSRWGWYFTRMPKACVLCDEGMKKEALRTEGGADG